MSALLTDFDGWGNRGRAEVMTLSRPRPPLLPFAASDFAPVPRGQALVELPGGAIAAIALAGCEPADLMDDAHIGTDALRAAVAIQSARDAQDWPEADRLRALHGDGLTIANGRGWTACKTLGATTPSLVARLGLIAARSVRPTRSHVALRRYMRSSLAHDAEVTVTHRPWSRKIDGKPPKLGRRFGRKSRKPAP